MFGIQKIVSHVACPIGADAGNPQAQTAFRSRAGYPPIPRLYYCIAAHRSGTQHLRYYSFGCTKHNSHIHHVGIGRLPHPPPDSQGNPAAFGRARRRHLRHPLRRQPPVLRRRHRGTRRLSVRARHLPARAVPSAGLSHGPAPRPVPHQDVPSQRRQAGPHLPGHPQG